MKTCNQLFIMLLIISLMAVLLSGCRFQLSFGIGSFVTGESYANAEAYQTGAFTYEADQVEAIEIYWRSGEVELPMNEKVICMFSVKGRAESQSTVPAEIWKFNERTGK